MFICPGRSYQQLALTQASGPISASRPDPMGPWFGELAELALQPDAKLE